MRYFRALFGTVLGSFWVFVRVLVFVLHVHELTYLRFELFTFFPFFLSFIMSFCFYFCVWFWPLS